MNTLGQNEKDDIWVPVIVFYNTDKKFTSRNDEKTRIQVTLENNGTLNGKEIANDIEIYEGVENPLKMSRVYDIDFLCNYQIQWYPFDIQVCDMIFVTNDVQMNFVELKEDDLKFLGPQELTQYFVKNFTMKTTTLDSGQKGIKVPWKKNSGNLSYYLSANGSP